MAGDDKKRLLAKKAIVQLRVEKVRGVQDVVRSHRDEAESIKTEVANSIPSRS